MCDWWWERTKAGKCKAMPKHTTEVKAWKYCEHSPAFGTSCGNENELTSSNITVTEAGAECSQCQS